MRETIKAYIDGEWCTTVLDWPDKEGGEVTVEDIGYYPHPEMRLVSDDVAVYAKLLKNGAEYDYLVVIGGDEYIACRHLSDLAALARELQPLLEMRAAGERARQGEVKKEYLRALGA